MTSKAGRRKAGRAQTLSGKTNTGPVCHNPPQETKEMVLPKFGTQRVYRVTEAWVTLGKLCW